MYSFCKKYGFDKSIEHIKESISAILSNRSLKFKSQCFSHEEEYRIIIKVPKKNNSFDIKYRTVRGCIIPYIEIEFKQDFISGVIIGPLLNIDTAKSSLKSFLKSKGYIDENISNSKIPIRY